MFPVIDLFAGPGGLNEGFSNVKAGDGSFVFNTLASYEMDALACQTLRLRSTYRELVRSGGDLKPYFEYISGKNTWQSTLQGTFKDAYFKAKDHVYRVELGEVNRGEVDSHIASKLGSTAERGHWALIGGPPCQAYSLAGRSRRTGDDTFASDHKHFLYREYLHILDEFQPTIFVMENVKGLLSSKNGDTSMFETILNDLEELPSGARYEIRSLVVDVEPNELAPSDFIIRSEEYGVPQKRHRVILLGVRSDVAAQVPRIVLSKADGQVSVRTALEDMPRLRAETSRRKPKTVQDWAGLQSAILDEMGAPTDTPTPSRTLADESFRSWVREECLEAPVQHVARAHMVSDLVRYRVMAEMANRLGKSPKFTDLPRALHPDHQNVGKIGTPFTDRFRVQVWDSPSTTVVSHISKDGHYYIHPDPTQNRSLTVREAARLQTFPDNYFFEGARTHQFHQVGNAVPPLLSKQIGEIVAKMMQSLL